MVARRSSNPSLRVPAGLLLVAAALLLSTRPAAAEFLAGAAAVDCTPVTLPVLVNGGMTSRSLDVVRSRLHVRAIALESNAERAAIVIVDSCMMARDFLDGTKAEAAARTGIPADRILVGATHTHSAPAAMGCLGTDADPAYVPFLRERIVEAVARAWEAREPARVGFASADAAGFTALRQWIRRPDRVGDDPFGNSTVRANMHAAANPDDVTGEAGPEDPALTLLSLRAADGRPLAVLGNFSMHYFGDADIGADYFGLFCEGLERRLAPEPEEGKRCVVLLSHGCSGDIWRVDYRVPEGDRPRPTIADYASGLVDLAATAIDGIEHRADADLAMAERRIGLAYRVPDRQRLEWAERIVAALGDRLPETQEQVYAREQVLLHRLGRTEVVVQALRLGDVAIATTPCETYAVTGLKIKAASPLPRSFVIELANGGDGYIPPPEQHPLGGYNTWPARSAGLEVEAEPRIAEAAIELLEAVCGAPRRSWRLPEGPAVAALRALRPVALWRLDDATGPHAVDSGEGGHDAVYEPGVTFWLDGPDSEAHCGPGAINRCVHFAGGRVRGRVAGLGSRYTLAGWIWNGLPLDARGMAGWCFSRGPDHGLVPDGDHLGLTGSVGDPGRLRFLHGAASATGRTAIPRWTWHHVVLVRDGGTARVYLDGRLDLETDVPATSGDGPEEIFLGGRSDRADGWEGRLDEFALFDRPLTAAEIARIAPRRPTDEPGPGADGSGE